MAFRIIVNGRSNVYDGEMNTEWLTAKLAEAERNMQWGEEAVAGARVSLARAERTRVGIAEARDFLATLERAQAILIGDRDRLKKELERG